MVGQDRISAMTEATPSAKIVNEEYDNARLELLVGHPWNFALKRVELAQSVDDPLFDWDYQFQLPNDCLRVLKLNEADDEYQIEGRLLLCNVDTALIKYISDITDVSKFSRPFTVALEHTIADRICFKLSQNAALADRIEKKAAMKLREARSYDAQEGSSPLTDNNFYRNARYR